MNSLLSFFSTPARQALGWTILGILGIGMAAGGVWFLTSDGDGSNVADADAGIELTATPSRTAAATNTSTQTSTATASATATETPSPTATTQPATNTGTGTGTTGGQNTGSGTGSGGNGEPEPTATPVVQQPVAGGAYCPPASVGQGTLPSGRVAGAVKVSGADAAPGSVELYIAFDGVPGPARLNHVAGGFNIDFWAAQEGCANRVGAAISVYANGQYFATGRTVGDGGLPLIPVTVELP